MSNAKTILAERLAKGEITEADYDRLISKLEVSDPTTKPVSPAAPTDPRVLNLIRQSLPADIQTSVTAEYNALPERTKEFISEIEYLSEYKDFYEHYQNRHDSADRTGMWIGTGVGVIIILAGYSKEAFVIGLLVGFAIFWIASNIIQKQIRNGMKDDIKIRLGHLFRRKADAALASQKE